jgi:hypothetical protein
MNITYPNFIEPAPVLVFKSLFPSESPGVDLLVERVSATNPNGTEWDIVSCINKQLSGAGIDISAGFMNAYTRALLDSAVGLVDESARDILTRGKGCSADEIYRSACADNIDLFMGKAYVKPLTVLGCMEAFSLLGEEVLNPDKKNLLSDSVFEKIFLSLGQKCDGILPSDCNLLSGSKSMLRVSIGHVFNLSRDSVQAWHKEALNCGLPNQTPVPVQVAAIKAAAGESLKFGS